MTNNTHMVAADNHGNVTDINQSKMIAVDNRGNAMQTDKSHLIASDNRGNEVATDQTHTLAVDKHGNAVETDKEVTTFKDGNEKGVLVDEMKIVTVKDKKTGKETEVEQHHQVIATKNERTGETDYQIVNEHYIEGPDGGQVLVREDIDVELNSDGEIEAARVENTTIAGTGDAAAVTKDVVAVAIDSDGEIDAHVEKSYMHGEGSDMVATKEVVDLNIDSDGEIDALAHEETIAVVEDGVLVVDTEKTKMVALSRSFSADSEDTLILMKKLEKKLKKRGSHSPAKHAPAHGQVKARGVDYSRSSSDIVATYTTQTHTYRYDGKKDGGIFGCLYG